MNTTYCIEVDSSHVRYWDKSTGYWRPGGRDLYNADRGTFNVRCGHLRLSGIASEVNAQKTLKSCQFLAPGLPLRVATIGRLALNL